MDKATRVVGLVVSGLGLAVGAYMALIVAGDGIARYALTGTQAQEFARAACSQIQGCKSLGIEAGYDWRNGGRRVIYKVQMARGVVDQSALTQRLPELGWKEGGVLGWALRVPSALVVSVDRGAASAGERKGAK